MPGKKSKLPKSSLPGITHHTSPGRRIIPRKKVEEQLLKIKSEGRYRRLFEESPVGLLETDWSALKKCITYLKKGEAAGLPVGVDSPCKDIFDCIKRLKITDANEAVLRLYEAEDKEEFMHNLDKVILVDCMDLFKKGCLAILEGKNEFECEDVNQTLKGKKKNVHVRISVLPGYEKSLSKIIIAITDITGRKGEEKKREAMFKWVQSIIDGVAHPVLVVGEDYRITMMNQAAIEFSLSKIKKSGPLFCFKLFHNQDTPCGHDCPIHLVRELGKPVTVTHKHRRAKGDWRFVEIMASPLWGEDGSFQGVIQSVHDITERRKAQEVLRRDKENFEELVNERTRELVESQMELEKVRRLSDIGTLAATVAHELRNPLVAIQMAAYNIKRKSRNPSLDRHLHNIEKKISESDQIINNLLFYSRIKKPVHGKIIIHDILEECIATAKRRWNEYEGDIRKRLASIKDVLVEADELQMRELFDNMLNNALDACEGKGGRIEIKADLKKGDSVEICFKDNGVGIKKDLLEKICEPFFTTKAKGTGLGLSVCSKIIKLHDGALDVQSKQGRGTTITIHLPVQRK